MCMGVLPACPSVDRMRAMPSRGQKRASVSPRTGDRLLWAALWVLGIEPGPPEEAKCSQLPSHSFSPPMAAFEVGLHYYFKISGEILKLDHLFNVIKVKALGIVEILVQMCLLQNQMLLYSAGYGIILTNTLDQATRWRWDPGLVLTVCGPAGISNTMEISYQCSHLCLIVWADFLF